MIKKIGSIEAIIAINPDAQVNIHGEDYNTIDWNAGTAVISKADIDAKIVELEADWTDNKYQRDRAEQFPELKEQLDLLFHDMTAGKGTKSGNWYKAISKVKTDNPKPE